MKLKNYLALLCACGCLSLATACSDDDDDNNTPIAPPAFDNSGYAKGADVSWLTQMEKEGRKFYNTDGKEMECMELLRSMGLNSIRLRVWVNPSDGWCNKGDLLVKAIRANNLGMRLMIDFHYSDSWADPGKQPIPAAWAAMSVDEVKEAVKQHTTEVLDLLKTNGITPEWVQIGNETTCGMLWPLGNTTLGDENVQNYAKFHIAGYEAAKAVFPNIKTIVHIDNGYNNARFRNILDKLRANNAQWDVVGMSLYPESDNWQTLNDGCIENARDMISRYNCEVMLCEIGMSWQSSEAAKLCLADLMEQSKSISDNKFLGIFWWEPQVSESWNGYQKGAFDNNGKPTIALDAFK